MIRIIITSIVFGVVLLASSITVMASTPPTVLYLQVVPHYMNSVEEGTYVDMIKRFSDEYGPEFDFKIATSERIEKLLVKGEEDYCSLGFSVQMAETEGLKTDHLIESQSFNRIYTSIISRRVAPIDTVNDLNNKTLVVYHGNYQDAAQRIPQGFDTSIVTVYNLAPLVKLVLKGRAEAGFVTTPDILMSPDYLQSMSELHLAELPDSDRREALVCVESEENRRLINLFNQFIDKLKSNNQLAPYIDYKQISAHQN